MDPRRGHLDPEDWNALRDVCCQVVDEMVQRFEAAFSGPVWREILEEVEQIFRDGLPEEGRPIPEVLVQVRENFLPYTLGNTYPRFFGWVNGAGTSAEALAEFLGGSINATMDSLALESEIRRNLEAGHRPFVVVATVGSVTCGATDDLRGLRSLCHRGST